MALHLAVFDYLKRHVTFKETNLNNYILVKNNYLPIENLSELESEECGGDGGLILVSKSQFVQMLDHIKLQSERFKMTPTKRFA